MFEPTRINERNKNWTNNNAESINNIFKIAIDWKPQRTRDLILKLYGVVELHYMDYRSALHGHGNYALANEERNYHVHDAVWRCKDETEKNQLFQNFLKDTKRKQKSKFITSQNGKFSVIYKVKGTAKKPGQRRRPINERSKIR